MGPAQEPSLELYHNGSVVFSSHSRWLHPLLELEEFLKSGPPASECRLRDRVVGRAAALLEVRLGLRVVHAAVLSRLGRTCSAGTACATPATASWTASPAVPRSS